MKKLIEETKKNKKELTNFLCDLVALPRLGGSELDVIRRIKKEMDRIGFEIFIDPMGNIISKVGSGKRVIAFDGHVDTVEVGEVNRWEHNPYFPFEDEGFILGRGSVDQKSGLASMIYAGKIIKDLKLYPDFTFYFVGSVQEEDFEGVNWEYIIKENKIEPELVIITEPSNLKICCGHRGRAEIMVTAEGKPCHASIPDNGENPLYDIAKVILEIEKLNRELPSEPLLGKGSIAVTDLTNQTYSKNSISSQSSIFLDRRLVNGETEEQVLEEVKQAAKKVGSKARVEISKNTITSYTQMKTEVKNFYPGWAIDEDHPAIQAGKLAFEKLFNREPVLAKWRFSTNATSIAGKFGIPCLGFGPGDEKLAHTTEEKVSVEQLIAATAFYAAYPGFFAKPNNYL